MRQILHNNIDELENDSLSVNDFKSVFMEFTISILCEDIHNIEKAHRIMINKAKETGQSEELISFINEYFINLINV
ncbi:hypothetical protein [Vallitalea okinawensis]|uniref:hypothetical protein n=1 Tax=Vallitalea okinawensis TaxID=2078660 RepID=UPI000CFCA173|nr:hypothetical protein [Vallitalea okinawensis]